MLLWRWGSVGPGWQCKRRTYYVHNTTLCIKDYLCAHMHKLNINISSTTFSCDVFCENTFTAPRTPSTYLQKKKKKKTRVSNEACWNSIRALRSKTLVWDACSFFFKYVDAVRGWEHGRCCFTKYDSQRLLDLFICACSVYKGGLMHRIHVLYNQCTSNVSLPSLVSSWFAQPCHEVTNKCIISSALKTSQFQG